MTRKQNGILFTLNFLLGTILNEDHETIAIVDEASLISDKPDEKPKFFAFGRGNGSGQLLTDLIAFLKLKDETFKTKLILFGDPCQLPPVLDKQSFALDTEFLKRRHRINAESIALNTVVRQAKDSGIVQAATLLRHSIEQGAGNYLVIQADGVSVKSSTRASILKHAALTAGVTPIPFTVIVFSNEMARDCNKSIRLALGRSALSVGDRLIVCANNRVFGLLNGTFVKVIKLADDIEEFTEIESNDILRFQDLDVEEEDPDKDGIRQVRTIKLFLNAFEEGKPPDISDALRNTLFRFARQRYSKLSKEEKKNSFGLNQDLYFNAVRAKYGYAITCHKAQGGEWPEVGIIFEKRNDVRSEKFRKWTYTALTRAKEVVYLEDAPEIHPLTRIKMQVEHGSVSQEIRMQARIAGKYSFGSPIEFLSLVLTDILAEHDINISSHSKLKQCVRITFSDTSNIESPESTVIDFYYTGEDRVAMFEKGHAPNIKEMNPALAKFILEKLAVRILPQAYLDRLEISKNQDSAGAATLAP